jgi:hypothetical protein
MGGGGVGAILIATEGGRCIVEETDSGFNQSCNTESQGKCGGGETMGRGPLGRPL